MLGNFVCYLLSADLYFKNKHFEKLSHMSQEYLKSVKQYFRHFVGHVLGPNCLQRFTADDTSM